MNHELKKNIRILSEIFNHEIEYNKNMIILKNKINHTRFGNRINMELIFHTMLTTSIRLT